MNKRKILAKALAGTRNLRFAELLVLAKGYGFGLDRITGSHHILSHPRVDEVVNLQAVRGKAKPYQVRQFLALVEQYNLILGEEEESA